MKIEDTLYFKFKEANLAWYKLVRELKKEFRQLFTPLLERLENILNKKSP